MNANGQQLLIVFRWFRLNLACFAFFFCMTAVAVTCFPDSALLVMKKWSVLLKAAGAKNIGEFAAKLEMFSHILFRNGLSLTIYFIIGLLLQSPLAMLFAGAFYGLVSFLAPYTLGRSFGIGDWFLISMEMLILVSGISLASAIAGAFFGVDPSVGSLYAYWKRNWYKLFPKPVSHWKQLFREWRGTATVLILFIALLLISTALFEVYGY